MGSCSSKSAADDIKTIKEVLLVVTKILETIHSAQEAPPHPPRHDTSQ